MAQPIKFYYDLLSPPCRALFMFMEASKIPFEPVAISLTKGDHLTHKFKENVNRLQKVPAINDKGFKLSESVAIFRYLVREKLVPDHWYPRNSNLRSQIDEYLEWQHNNLFLHGTDYFRRKMIYPILMNKEPDPLILEKCEKLVENSFSDFEHLWLKNNKYMFGSKITFADLLAICGIDQSKCLGVDPFCGRPKMADWYELVRESLTPYYDDVNQVLGTYINQAKNSNTTRHTMKA